LQSQFRYLITECRKIAEEAAKKATPKSKVVENKEDDLGEPAEKRQKLEDKRDEDEKSDKGGIVSSSMAKRLLRRIKLFEEIKKAVADPKLNERLSALDRSPPVPWWVIPLHDKYLLEYVAKYGIGSDEWTQILENKECIFYVNEDEKPEYKYVSHCLDN
jgi:hypothetical protein